MTLNYFFLLCLLISLSCKGNKNESDSKFIEIANNEYKNYYFLLEKVISEEYFLVYTNTKDEKLKDYIKEGIQAWLEPLKLFNKDINTKVHFMPYRSKLADLSVIFYEKQTPQITDEKICRSDYISTSNALKCNRSICRPEIKQIDLFIIGSIEDTQTVLFHELGHSFGLDDTYKEAAKSYHPISVMKGSGLKRDLFYRSRGRTELMYDDIMGITYLFCKKFPNRCDAEFFQYKNQQYSAQLVRNNISFKEAVRLFFNSIGKKKQEEKMMLNIFKNHHESLKKLRQLSPDQFSRDTVVAKFMKITESSPEKIRQFRKCISENDFFDWALCDF